MMNVRFCLAISIFLLTSCKSMTPANQSPSVPAAPSKPGDFFSSQGFQQLTFFGDNESPRFSETGNEIIFISRQRNSHNNAQVYEIDLIKNSERRVTFNDGNDSTPSFIDGRQIMYASNTDEIKENLNFLVKNKSSDKAPEYSSDLYVSDDYGNNIERITNNTGFDGEAIYVKASKPSVIFVSKRNSAWGLYRTDLQGAQTSPLLVDKTKEFHNPALSPDQKKLAWIEKDLSSGKESVKMMTMSDKKITLLKENGGTYRDLAWSGDAKKIFYSVVRSEDKRYQIEAYDLEKTCTYNLFKGQESLLQADISRQDPPRIVFVRDFGDKKQIYLAQLPSDLGPCAPEASHTKLDK